VRHSSFRLIARFGWVLVGSAAIALVAGAGLTVASLQREAADRQKARAAFAELAENTRRLDRIVLSAVAEGHADDAVFARVVSEGQRIDAQLDQDALSEDGRQVGVAAALNALDRYRGVAERLLAALAHRDRHAGGADAALGPAFEELDARLAAVQRTREREAARAGDRALRLSALTVGALLAVLLGMVGLYHRNRRRAHVAASRQEALTRSEAHFRAIVDDSSDLILVVGADGLIRSASCAASDLLGIDAAELERRPLAELLHPDDLATIAARGSGARHWRVELRMRHPNGYWLNVEAAATEMAVETAGNALVLTVRDVSERKAFEEQLRHRAFHDPLTQLANRALFLDRLEHALHREGRFEDLVAVLFVDLDDFKLINDTLGHAAGDELLVMLAARLRSCLRSSDTAARFGGDEFGVLLEGVDGIERATGVADRVLEALAEPFSIGRLPVMLSASVGVALGRAGETSADELLRNADIAMYAAKSAGKGRREVFRADRHADLARRFPSRAGAEADRVTWFERSEEQRNEVLRLLRHHDAIVPAFQPIIDMRDGELAGYEALARFPRDATGRPPNAWFAQAHRCGLGVELETRALLSALETGAHTPGGYLSVNISPAALRGPDLLAQLPQNLHHVVVEITEHELVADGERLRATLSELRARGARIAVDDAGAGYAGLRQLMVLRPDLIKLDRSLIEDVAGDEAKQALVECFVRFAQRTGAAVCAEGIEREEDLIALSQLGVTYGQGYFIARPGHDWPRQSERVRALFALQPDDATAPATLAPAG
jgi:diguanylate cyclase (GGDEF)-like protein/PAS domain S-box-containing protein